jgi:glycosyltransferase involved in cell wall biosynthesis
LSPARRRRKVVATASPRVAMVCATQSSIDAILDYARGLGNALATLHGLDVDGVVRSDGGWSICGLGPGDTGCRTSPTLDDAMKRADALILHYNPFSWGRRGFAPQLVRDLACVRRRKPGLVVGVLAHERYVDMRGLRGTLMGGWQRVQYLAILQLADVAWSSTERWSELLRRQTRARVGQMPICSTVPDGRAARSAMRERLGLDASTLVVATFGSNHPSRLIGHVELAVAAIARAGCRVVLLNLGAEPPPVIVPGVRVVTPGRLDANIIAEHLAAADVYLAPFIDGVSGRRTSLMAALQHGLPVIGTYGPMTDSAMRAERDALLLTPSADGAGFASAARDLALDAPQRARRAAAARRFYESRFDWPVACRAALNGLTGMA